MPFTEAELAQMQEEAEKEIGEEAAASEKTVSESAEVVDKTETKEDEKQEEKSEKEPKDVAESKAASEDKEDDDYDDIRELRERNRLSEAKLDKVTKDYERLVKLMKAHGLVDEDEEKEQNAREEEAKQLYAKRLTALGEMLEVMKVNPKYEDVESVVSQNHFDDMVTALAKYHANQQGGDVRTLTTEIEREIWALPNPYKYMYDLIKKYHPEYAKKSEAPQAKSEDTPKGDSVEKGSKKQPFSLQNLLGGSGDASSWTAARIDAMDEDELSKVPSDIYEKYLRGELQ